MPRVLKRLQDGEAIPVEAWDRDGKVKLATGKLLTVDNQIDTATGTVKLKAEFANDNRRCSRTSSSTCACCSTRWPTRRSIPSAAIQRGAPGTFVYVVKDDKSVSVTPVKLGPVQGETTAIASGLAPGDLVVVDGADKLREGAKVELITRDAQAARRPAAGAVAAAATGRRAAAGQVRRTAGTRPPAAAAGRLTAARPSRAALP